MRTSLREKRIWWRRSVLAFEHRTLLFTLGIILIIKYGLVVWNLLQCSEVKLPCYIFLWSLLERVNRLASKIVICVKHTVICVKHTVICVEHTVRYLSISMWAPAMAASHHGQQALWTEEDIPASQDCHSRLLWLSPQRVSEQFNQTRRLESQLLGFSS